MSTMSEHDRQQQEDRNELALTDPDDAKDAYFDSFREERMAEQAALADQRDLAEAQAESNYEELQGEKYLEQTKDADTVVEPTELF